ncbi:unnamed protein product [Linum tenue]|uniref:Glycosyltransferase n=1 Tax=Linum tenue TaxID=586396 RepID=A0AAV0I008_9ROSI|nr:unnamed protein product [Linum tenue]
MVLMPSSGAGHVIPFLKVAGALARQNCRVTLITSHPLVSKAESAVITRFLTLYPQVTEKKFHLLHLPPNHSSSFTDPFFRQWELIHLSLPRLSDVLESLSPPADALLSDITLMSSTISVTESLNLPNYVLYTTSARMFAFFAYYPALSDALSNSVDDDDELLEIPGLEGLPKSSVPPMLQDTTSPFATMLRANSDCIKKFDGFLMNTFDALEGRTLSALKSGKIVDGMPPIFDFLFPPWEPEEVMKGGRATAWKRWLDEQPPASVVYVSFGSRTPLSREQTLEVAKGLISCHYPFMWVAKGSVVDKEDGVSLQQVLGEDLARQMEEKGVVVKDWVDQLDIIGHKSVGGFVTHCGWSSIVEASSYGVPMLGWPQIGDQRITGVAMAECGVGILGGKWGWNGEFVVKGEEIGMHIREMMENQKLRSRAAEVMEDINKVVAPGGVCDRTLKHFLNKFKS